MKTEAILQRVNAALTAFADAPSAPGTELLRQLAADLEAQIRAEYAAGKGRLNAQKAFQKLLDSVEKCRTPLRYAWIDENGLQCACNGCEAFRLRDHLPTKPRPEDAGTPIDLSKIIPAADERRSYAAVPLPSAAELKAHIATERAKNGRRADVLWDLGEGRPVVNAAYLMDLLAILPDAAEIYCKPGAGGLISPLYAAGTGGEAVILPVRPTDNGERAAAADELAAEHAAQTGGKEAAARRYAELLADYAARAAEDPDYALTPEQFAEIARVDALRR